MNSTLKESSAVRPIDPTMNDPFSRACHPSNMVVVAAAHQSTMSPDFATGERGDLQQCPSGFQATPDPQEVRNIAGGPSDFGVPSIASSLSTVGSRGFIKKTSPSPKAATAKKRSTTAKKKKAKKSPIEIDKPKRPLTGYNIFFKEERSKILSQIPDRSPSDLAKYRNKSPNRPKPHGKIDFQSLAKTIGAKWKVTGPDRKAHYQKLAEEDKKRYNAEMEVWGIQQGAERTYQLGLLRQQVPSSTMEEYLARQSKEAKRAKKSGELRK